MSVVPGVGPESVLHRAVLVTARAGTGVMEVEGEDLLSELLERLTQLETVNAGLKQANAQFEDAKAALLQANRELQGANDDLRANNARLQATNDELRESDGVLRALIKDLRESEAVLQDSNAELREANSELRATNSELRQLLSVVVDVNARTEQKEVDELVEQQPQPRQLLQKQLQQQLQQQEQQLMRPQPPPPHQSQPLQPQHQPQQLLQAQQHEQQQQQQQQFLGRSQQPQRFQPPQFLPQVLPQQSPQPLEQLQPPQPLPQLRPPQPVQQMRPPQPVQQMRPPQPVQQVRPPQPVQQQLPKPPLRRQQYQLLLQEQVEEENLLGAVGPAIEEAATERAINYQALMDLEHGDLVPNLQPFDCPICFSSCAVVEGITLRDCLHSFCKACLQHTVQYTEEAMVKCPFRDEDYACDSVLQEREVKALVPDDVYEQHLARTLAQAEARTDNAFHCKTPDCGGWCVFEDDVNQFPCPVCRHTNCLTCQAIHERKNCKQYQDQLKLEARTNDEARQSQEAIETMLQSGEAMLCPSCRVVIKKKGGCDFITCSMCRTDICWVTRGPRWGKNGRGDTSGGCRCRLNGKKCHPKCRNCH